MIRAARACVGDPRAVNRANRRAAAALGCALVAAFALLVIAPSSQAAVTHEYSFSFNTINPSPLQIAIDQADGYVYVETPSSSTGYGGTAINKFDALGNPVNFSDIGESQMDGCCAFNGQPDTDPGNNLGSGTFAVDNSPGATNGDIFAGGGQVFSPAGHYVEDIVGTSSDNPGQTGGICGVTLDPLGAVYVAHQNTGSADLPRVTFIDKFIPGSRDLPSAWKPLSTLYTTEQESCGMAVDSTGALYDNSSQGTQLKPLTKYASNLFDLLPDDPFSSSVCGCRGPTGKIVDPSVDVFTIDPSDDDLYADEGGQVAHYDSEGDLLETFGAGELTNGTGVAVNETTGTVYVADAADNSVRVYKAVVTPDIADVSATAGQTSAAISAHITPAGSPSVTACQIEYGTTASYGSTAPCSPAPPYSAGTDVSADLSSLTTEMTYHYRVDATNANGVHYGVDHTFTTHAVADVETAPASDITQSGATLNGSFTGNGADTHYLFEWGSDTSYGQTTPDVDAGSGTGGVAAMANLTGLDVYTPSGGVYHYRLVAHNGAGTTYGQDRTFHTESPALPAISDTNAVVETPSSAMLEAQVNPGLGETFYFFEYGPTAAYGEHTDSSASIGSDNSDHPVSTGVTGLMPGLTYHFRAVATNFTGSSFGPDETFNTPDSPVIEETGAAGITTTTATLSARIRPSFRATTYHFDYGPTEAYGASTPESGSVGADNAGHAAGVAVSGLAAGTTYHFRVVATNAIGTVFGPDRTLTTASPPSSPPQPTECRKGFVKRHGKCVKKKHKKKHRRGHVRRSHG